MGVSRETHHHDDVLIGGLLAGAAALLYTLKVPQGIIYSGGFLLASRRSRRPCSAVSATCVVPCWAVCCWHHGELRPGLVRHPVAASVVAFVLLVLVLLFRPTGILGESLGKARA